MAAYLRAVEAGADAVECDVRLTADGTLVLVHDRRIDRTSPGSGAVSNFMLAELQEHTFGGQGWHDFEDPPSELRTRLLTLEMFLSTLLDASSTVEFAIETKHPTRFGGYVEEELARVLRSFGLVRDGSAHRVRMMSFSRMAVVRMKKLIPGISTVYLCRRKPVFFRDWRLPPGAMALGPGIDVLRKHPDLVDVVKSRGGQVHVWVVDSRDDFDLCRELGVDVIITNTPSQILAWLGR
jgi:glycerophosphoryl diester phosphodiesterase